MKRVSNALLASQMLAATTMQANFEKQVSMQGISTKTNSTSFFVGIRMPKKQWKKHKANRTLAKNSRKANRR